MRRREREVRWVVDGSLFERRLHASGRLWPVHAEKAIPGSSSPYRVRPSPGGPLGELDVFLGDLQFVGGDLPSLVDDLPPPSGRPPHRPLRSGCRTCPCRAAPQRCPRAALRCRRTGPPTRRPRAATTSSRGPVRGAKYRSAASPSRSGGSGSSPASHPPATYLSEESTWDGASPHISMYVEMPIPNSFLSPDSRRAACCPYVAARSRSSQALCRDPLRSRRNRRTGR